jgi:hypothetical protein
MNKQIGVPIPESTVYSVDLIDDDRYPIVLVDGYKVLLDTGCPFTFRMPGGPDVLEFLGQQVRLKPMPLSRGFVNEGFDLLKVRFDALIGLDVLMDMAWTINLNAHTTQATSGTTDEEETTWIPLDALDGPPIFKLDDGTQAILDTGAHISYRVGPVPPTSREIGQVTDWSLLWGTIRSPLWEDTIQIGGHRVPVQFGKLPKDADASLAWMKTEWILGADLLRQFIVTMDFANERLGLRPLV